MSSLLPAPCPMSEATEIHQRRRVEVDQLSAPDIAISLPVSTAGRFRHRSHSIHLRITCCSNAACPEWPPSCCASTWIPPSHSPPDFSNLERLITHDNSLPCDWIPGQCPTCHRPLDPSPSVTDPASEQANALPVGAAEQNRKRNSSQAEVHDLMPHTHSVMAVAVVSSSGDPESGRLATQGQPFERVFVAGYVCKRAWERAWTGR